MRLKELELYSKFRGLQPGFKIVFNRPVQPINRISPLCFVGLNGSGKSNVMQLLAEIFFYLENYVLLGLGSYFDESDELSFQIHYLLPVTPRNFLNNIDKSESLSTLTWRGVIITKRKNEQPVFEYYYDSIGSKVILTDQNQFASLLPNEVIGYSSGMNELISNPFIKMDLFYLDNMKRKLEASSQGTTLQLTVNRLFFLDYQSNALMVLANFLAKEEIPGRKTELDIINDIVGIEDIQSFRISFNFRIKQELTVKELMEKLPFVNSESEEFDITDFVKDLEIPSEFLRTISNLDDCSTTRRVERARSIGENKEIDIRLELYFQVDAETKRAFRDKFRGGIMQLFQQLYLLNLLNIENYPEDVRSQVRNARFAENVADLLPRVPISEKVFHVDKLRLKKKNGQTLFYKQLSDGEHQYMQVAGGLMLMNENASLFLMDEPETHFNPEWRSRLFSTLNDILKRRIENDPDHFIPQQEIIVTSHSPFIISDCQPEQVYIFDRDPSTLNVQFRQPTFNTYGASVDLITEGIFSKKETISGLPFNDLERLKENLNTLEDIQSAKEQSRKLGESVEKVFLFNYLIEKENEIKANANRL